MTEQWRPVVGHEGAYEVSDQGRVRSLPHRVRLVVRGGVETSRLSPGKVLRPGRCLSGHVSVAIGKGRSVSVHVLVLTAFVGPRPAGYDILHLNHDPADNRLENLRYGTRSENLRMDYENGSRVKTHCKRGHLLSGDNLFPSHVNYARQCRTCALQTAKERYHRRKTA